MNTRPARVIRGLAAALFAVFVASFSHVAGGGTAPGTVGLVLALAFSAVVCVGLAGKSLSIIRLSASVALSQLVLHALFSVGANAGDATLTVSGMGHHGSMLVSISEGTAAAAATFCSWMWVAHVLAAVVTVLALRRGEGAFWGLVSLAGRRFTRLVRPLFVEPRPVLRPDRSRFSLEPDHPRDLGIFLGRLRHRGPPVCVRIAS
ncbi:hypothetical protein [Subtercola boreus]|uniref:MFS transporter n=1 Tax=Subtercola boreus TaxID=120213 RepID=A0A3E0WFE0_9MICO|nr:hypothetical protein [Subtercola boreus]RFA22557.1 hypothetical protein B7R24_02725 [Subtercola boreus]RFA22913.1 hypothetical protein B7R23_02720 [Subtercola boreus]RFA28664.1 hypothetical protein B7R25_02735 [Subtercola boreus]